MHIDTETTVSATTWRFRGRLDVFAIGYLRGAFAAAGEPGTLVLDLTELEEIEPVAIGVLRQGLREQTAKGTRVALCGGSNEIRRILHLVGIARSFPMLSTAPEAAHADVAVCAVIPPAAIPPRPLDPDLLEPVGRRTRRMRPGRARPSIRGLARLLARRRVGADQASELITLSEPDVVRSIDPDPVHLKSEQPV